MTEQQPAPESPARTLPAGKVLLVMLGALLFAGVFNSSQFVAAAEGMPYGWQRTVLLGIARPFDDVSRALRLDRPRAGLDSALGRRTEQHDEGAFARALPEPDGSPVPESSAAPSPAASAPDSPQPAPRQQFRDAGDAAPLKLFVTGDSMIEFMASKLIGAGGASIDGASEVKYGTGLVRDDFFDWPAYARSQMASRHPEAVVMQLGGNDGQNIQLADRTILQAGSPQWVAEYQRRATLMMQIFTGNGQRQLYWIGMPPAQSGRLFGIYRELNTALAAAARSVPGVTYVDIWHDFAPDGHYTDFLSLGGRKVLVRARDGIHVNGAGAGLVAQKLYSVIGADWKLAS